LLPHSTVQVLPKVTGTELVKNKQRGVEGSKCRELQPEQTSDDSQCPAADAEQSRLSKRLMQAKMQFILDFGAQNDLALQQNTGRCSLRLRDHSDLATSDLRNTQSHTETTFTRTDMFPPKFS
jgi:hypothetical protein